MPLFDLPLDQLREYRSAAVEPADFDPFWQATLTDQSDLDAVFEPIDVGLPLVQAADVRFSGFGGDRVAGWFVAPAHVTGPVPCVVQYLGYGAGRGSPHEWLVWPAAGYAVLVMDTRGQGGDTADPDGGGNAQEPGFVTRGILDPERYYYRRLFVDGVRAVDAARSHPLVDGSRLVVAGASQGGAISQAVAGLRSDLIGAMVDVPFLTDVGRAMEITDELPYRELVDYCARHRNRHDDVFRTLGYVDGVHFAARAAIPALYSVGLMDPVCPPSTVFAAYHAYGGPAEIQVWPYNEHEGGGTTQQELALRWAAELLLRHNIGGA